MQIDLKKIKDETLFALLTPRQKRYVYEAYLYKKIESDFDSQVLKWTLSNGKIPVEKAEEAKTSIINGVFEDLSEGVTYEEAFDFYISENLLE